MKATSLGDKAKVSWKKYLLETNELDNDRFWHSWSLERQ